MKISSVFTHSLTALVMAGSASVAFAQSNTSGSPSSPAPAAANQSPPPVGSEPKAMKPKKKTNAERKPAADPKGNNTSSAPSNPAPAAANQPPPPVGTTAPAR